MDGITLNYQKIKNMFPGNKPTFCHSFFRMFCLPSTQIILWSLEFTVCCSHGKDYQHSREHQQCSRVRECYISSFTGIVFKRLQLFRKYHQKSNVPKIQGAEYRQDKHQLSSLHCYSMLSVYVILGSVVIFGCSKQQLLTSSPKKIIKCYCAL